MSNQKEGVTLMIGKLLIKRSGRAFTVTSPGEPGELGLRPYIDEAMEWARKAQLGILLALPVRAAVMSVEATSNVSMLLRGWQNFVQGRSNAYLGRDPRVIHEENIMSRRRRLDMAPSLVISDAAGWKQLKQQRGRRGDGKAQFDLAERWGQLMQLGINLREDPRDNVYTSLLYADPDGIFNSQNRTQVLEPLRRFWPPYETMIRQHLDNF